MANLEITKLVDKSFIVLSSDNNTLSYTIKIINNGTTPASDVNLKDVFPKGVSLLNGAIYLDGEKISCVDLKCGINLGTLEPGAEWTITFSVKISLSSELKKIDNIANIIYTDENGAHDAISNLVTTQIIIINICIDKTADKCFALLGQTFYYTVKIKNKGNISINSATLKDIHSDGIEIISNAEIEDGLLIGTINPNQTITVMFQAKVTEIPCPAVVKNKVCLNFTYDIPETSTPITSEGFSESDTVEVKIGPRSFKEINVSGNITLPNCKPAIKEIIDKNVEVKIINVKKIKTIKNVSYEGQVLTGCKIMVTGEIKLTVEYFEKNCNHGVYLSNFTVPFMSYIVAPSCCKKICTDDINATIEDIYISKVNCNSLYHDILLVLEYVDSHCIED